MIREQNSLFSHDLSPGEEIRKDPIGALTLFTTSGVGSAFFRSLLKSLGSPGEVLSARRKTLESVPGIGASLAEAITSVKRDGQADRIMEDLQKCRAKMVSIWDDEYPANLREIHDPPALLFVCGNLPRNDEVRIAVVGTRTPSIYGVHQAHCVAEELAKSNVCTVSGMARGIDTAAHEGSLQGNGKTYAVFGCGIDIIYPTENKSLASKIEENGALISEFVTGTKPDPGLFPRRNRIISGLSSGVLVIQGEEKSGALITAKLAVEQNREVFSLPGSVDDRRSRGPHLLIREGATLITSAADILAEIGLQSGGEPSAKSITDLPQLSNSEKAVALKLSSEPIHIDKLVQELNLPVASVLSDLLNMEMKGWVKQYPGKLFSFNQGIVDKSWV